MTTRRAHQIGPCRAAFTLLLACAQFVLPVRALAMAPAGVGTPDAPAMVSHQTMPDAAAAVGGHREAVGSSHEMGHGHGDAGHGPGNVDAPSSDDAHGSAPHDAHATHESGAHASHASSGCHGGSPAGPSNCFGADACSAPAVQGILGAQVSSVTLRVRVRPDAAHQAPSVCLSQQLRPPKSL